ncbi:MAG: ABC transporter substrate-binding protein [Dehalococcoidales bacterium]|nr:ABC transporter substrate-binding protein [Dehalococcoidales bacterium]
MRRYLIIFFTLIVTLALLITGCAEKKPEATTPSGTATSTGPVQGGTLKYILNEPPSGSIGIPENFLGMAGIIIPPVIEPLVIFDARANITGLLAESWEWSSDYRAVTLKLRKGVKFHDGSDFNADVCIWNWDRYFKKVPKESVDVAAYYKVDDYTVKIELTRFTNIWFCNNMRYGMGMMISKKWYEEKGEDYVNWHPVGTGPFKFKEYVDKDHMTLVRNDDYYGKKPNIDAIEYLFFADATAAQLSFENKEGDVLGAFGGARVADEMKAKGYAVNVSPGGLSIGLVPSVRNPNSPFANLKVREAVEYALNKEAIAKAVGKGYYNAWYQLAGGGQTIFDPNFVGRRYDPEKAKKLLAEAGYANGFKTKLICGTHLAGDELPLIQADLKAVGIDAEIEVVSVTKWIDYETNGWDEGLLESPLAFTELYGVDVNRYFVRPTTPNWSTGIYWDSMYRPDELEKACQEYLTMPLGEAEVAKGREIVKIIYDNVCIIPLWDQMSISIMQPWVKDIRKNLPYAAGPIMFDWWNVWIAQH